MDSLLLVILFSGLCMVSALGMSVFILAASIQSSRISKMKGIDEAHLNMRPMASDSMGTPLTESLF